jgi:hypothetical protein
MELTYTKAYNKVIGDATKVVKMQNTLLAGNLFKKYIEGLEKQLSSVSFVEKEKLSSELEGAIMVCFGRPMPDIYALNFQRVTELIEKINAYNKAQEDADRLKKAGEIERAEKKAAFEKSQAEKRAAGVKAGKITA